MGVKAMRGQKATGRFAGKGTPKRSPRRSGRRNIGDEIIAGLEEAIAFERGEPTGAVFKKAPIRAVSARKADAAPAPDYSKERIAKIRATLKLSQALFARVLNVSPETERAWEQGKAPPAGSAKRLLQIAETHPKVLLDLVVEKQD